MKYLIFSFFLLSLGRLQAQQDVLIRGPQKWDPATATQLSATYPPLSHAEVPVEVARKFDKMIADALRVKGLTGYMLTCNVYVNEAGQVDYILYRMDSTEPDKDSLQSRIEALLSPRLHTWELPTTSGGKFNFWASFSSGRVTGVSRTIRTGDSLVGTLEAARAEVDTLRVKKLILDQAKLTEVPYALIYRFPNLEVLDLHSNALTEVSLDLARLPRLENLDLRFNHIDHKKLTLTRNKSLKILNVQGNGLTDVPDAARACRRLESLWLGGNRKLDLTNRSFRRLRRVTDLNFYGCELLTLPRGLRKMRRLQVLDLYYNQLTQLPTVVTRLRKLDHLAVANNQLTTLPTRLDRLKRLEVLYAHHNRLSTLPDRTARLSHLRLLDLGYNGYSQLPPELLGLKNLRELDLSGNNFTTFPALLSEFRSLETLHLRGNPFLRPEGDQAYLPLIKKLEKNPTEVYY